MRRKVLFGGATLKDLIDARDYDAAFKRIQRSPDSMLSYMVINKHYPLYVSVVSAIQSLDEFDLDEISKLQKEDPVYDWITPLLQNQTLVHNLSFKHMFSLGKHLFSPKLIQMISGVINTEKYFKEIFNGAFSEGTPEQNSQKLKAVLSSFTQSQQELFDKVIAGYLDDNFAKVLELVPEMAEKKALLAYLQYASLPGSTYRHHSHQISEDLYVRGLKMLIEKYLHGSSADIITVSEVLMYNNYPDFAKYMDISTVKSLVHAVVKEYLDNFEFKTLLKLYLHTHLHVTSSTEFTTLIQKAISSGFSINGSTSFGKLIQDFESEIKHSLETIRLKLSSTELEAYKARANEFLQNFFEVYSDIPSLVAYSEQLGPRETDALYMYAYSSAVMNEPSKEMTYTKSQRKLTATRRRPTDIQHSYIEMLDTIVRSAPRLTKPLFAWRGVAVPSFDAVNLHLDIFKSLSLSADLAFDYLRESECCLSRVLIPAGTPLVNIDPVQKYKNDGGLFEYVLPRGAIFALQSTFQIGDKTVYDTVVEFDDAYESNLAIGRLRKRKVVDFHEGKRTKKIEVSKNYDAVDVEEIANEILEDIGSHYRGSKMGEEEMLKILERFRSRVISAGSTWRMRVLSRNQNVSESEFISLINEVCSKVSRALHNEYHQRIIQEIQNYKVDINQFYNYGRSRLK